MAKDYEVSFYGNVYYVFNETIVGYAMSLEDAIERFYYVLDSTTQNDKI